MNFVKNIPLDFNVSLTFIVLLMAFLTAYMAIRGIRRLTVFSAVIFAIQLFMLTTGILTVINKVISVPVYEIFLIIFGILMPGSFLVFDYTRMKSKIKKSNTDVPLIERIEKQSDIGWRYNEYIEKLDEWKNEIKPGMIAGDLELTDRRLKNNVIKQLSAVHKLIDTGEYKQALEIYNILSELLNGNAQILYNTAWLNYKCELYGEAIRCCKKALYILGDDSNPKHKRKKISEEMELLNPSLNFIYGMSLFAINKYVLAINQFTLAKKYIEELREADINIAKCYIALGELAEAQKHIRLALKFEEDNKLRYLLARLCFEKNEEMECRHQLETIVSNDPEFTEAWSLLGKLYRKRSDWPNALVVYKKLTSLTPHDADVYYRLGIAQRHEGKTEDAIASLKFTVDLMPEHSRAYYSLASIYDAQGKTDKAIEYLKKSLKGDERLEMAYNHLAEIYISTDRIYEAILVYEEAAREHPGSYLIHFNLGISLMIMKRYEEAVRVFKKAHKLTSDDPALYYNWASAVISLKNYSEAARLYKEGLKLKADDDEILFGLARVSALSGDVDATIGFLIRAFEINPNLRLRAKSSHDFAAYRTHPEFMEITRLPLKEVRKNA